MAMAVRLGSPVSACLRHLHTPHTGRSFRPTGFIPVVVNPSYERTCQLRTDKNWLCNGAPQGRALPNVCMPACPKPGSLARARLNATPQPVFPAMSSLLSFSPGASHC